MGPYVRFGFWGVVLLGLGTLQGCGPRGPARPTFPLPKHDPFLKRTEKDYQRLNCPPPPTFQPQPSLPAKPNLPYPPIFYSPVSLSFGKEMGVLEAIKTLAKKLKVNLFIDAPSLANHHFTYHAIQRPFIEILENLCAASGLRFEFTNQTLHIQEDAPHNRTYNIQFLLNIRKTKMKTGIKTDVFNNSPVGGGGQSLGEQNGSSIDLSADSDSDFWQELEKNIGSILQISPQNKSGETFFSINRYGGILSVHGKSVHHKTIERYLAKLHKTVTTQILIEAKIIEVALNEEFKNGINWNVFLGDRKFLAQSPFGPGYSPQELDKEILPIDLGKDVFTVSFQNKNLSAVATFMEQFGTVRTIANPRLTALNNQPAILKVGSNEVFFEVHLEDVLMTPNSPFVQRASSRIQTVPIGLILFVQPSVNVDSGEIILYLHPAISRIVGQKKDPAVELSIKEKKGAASEIPIVQVKELDSVVVTRENQVIVIGGLMEETSSNERTGLPGFSRIPFLGTIFGSKRNTKKTTELVVLLKVSTISSDNNGVTRADKRLYQCFGPDPRPASL